MKKKTVLAGAVSLVIFVLCAVILFRPADYSIHFEGVTTETGASDVPYSLSGIGNEDILLSTDNRAMTAQILEGNHPIYTFKVVNPRIQDSTNYNDISLYGTVVRHFPESPAITSASTEDLFDLYKNTDNIIFLSSSSGIEKSFDEEANRFLTDLGLEKAPNTLTESDRFVAVYDNGAFTYQRYEDCSFDDELSVRGLDVRFSVHGAYSSVTVNGEKYFSEQMGVYMMVYNPSTEHCIDAAMFKSGTADIDRIDDQVYTWYDITLSETFYNRVSNIVKTRLLVKKVLFVLLLLIMIPVIIDLCSIFSPSKRPRRVLPLLPKHLAVTVFVVLAFCLPIGLRYLEDSFMGISVNQILYHLTTDLEGTNWADFRPIIMSALKRLATAIGVSTLLFVLCACLIRKKDNTISRMIGFCTRFLAIALSVISIAGTYRRFDDNFGFFEYLVSYSQTSDLYETYYADPKTTEITFPDAKRNLIYIFLESMEITNMDTASGGCRSENLLPNLTALSQEHDDFRKDISVANGGHTPGNTTWTIAGMVAQNAGVPLDTPIQHNFYGGDSFLPGCYSIGQVLKEHGYGNYLMFGSDAVFGKRDAFYLQHGDYTIWDYNWANENHMIPNDYFAWWGFEDDKLFSIAEKQLTELSKSDQPFNLTILTSDTHMTNGYLCQDCEDTYPDQYSNVLVCNDKKIAEFIDWIKEQDFYENTTVILSGDHLYMDSGYYNDVPSDYDRKTYFTVINGVKQSSFGRDFTTMDIYPTTLSAMGCDISGNRLGLGTDLYSETPTLLEDLGASRLNYELSLRSPYYEKNILY